MEFFQRSLFFKLNQTPQRRKANAKVEQNPITTKHTTNFFTQKRKEFQRWQNLTCRNSRTQGK